jgi:GrpB-like predicted nucleotidyltransferase (UPF0157 family)
MLGFKKNLNILVDYDPSWDIAFIEERKRLARVLGKLAKGIEHYGSTAVPILDILVGVSPFDDWAKCNAPGCALSRRELAGNLSAGEGARCRGFTRRSGQI